MATNKRKPNRRRFPKHQRRAANTRPSILQMAAQLIRNHIDPDANVSPDGKEVWYYDQKAKVATVVADVVCYRGAQKQLSFNQAKQLVHDLWGTN